MKARINDWGIILLPLLLQGAAGCITRDDFQQRCGAEGVGVSISGAVTQGKGNTTPQTTPFVVKVQIQSDVWIQQVTVGGVSAKLEDVSNNIWEATLYEQDLEAARDTQRGLALLPVVAVDPCDGKHPIDTIEVPLGPAVGKLVSDLAIDLLLSPADECFLPADQGTPALLRLSASAGSAGATVSLKCTQGKFITQNNPDKALSLILEATGEKAGAEAYFLPDAAGTAIFTASGTGAIAEPKSILVVGSPSADGPDGSLERDITYTVAFRSAGNLSDCVLTETAQGAAEVLVVEPSLGSLTNTVSVLKEPKTCTDIETVKISVRFGASAPMGSSVTLRCFDTYGQQGEAKLSVDN